MELTQLHIDQYLDFKKNSWAPSTKRSEGWRLKGLLPLLNQSGLNPSNFYDLIKEEYGAYTTRTIFNRIGDFLGFLGNDSFTKYFQTNKNLFKYVYQHKFVTYSFEEAREQIKQIPHSEVRKVATLMLTTGMRIHEALKYDGSGFVIGKGGKPRPIFSKDVVNSERVSEATVRHFCKKVGINPHDLRKLAATQLAKSGLTEADLMYTMGWSNIQTAGKYLQPLKNSELELKVKGALQNAILK